MGQEPGYDELLMPMTSPPREVEIFALGHQGDGETAEGLYVPYTVPGARVRAEFDGIRGRLVDIVAPGPIRATPPCRHFGICGGCAVPVRGDDGVWRPVRACHDGPVLPGDKVAWEALL